MADISRPTLPASISADIWAKTLEDSAVMKMARRIDLPGNGLAIPVITGEPQADWVGETEAKPVSNSTVTTKLMQPYKLAVIETVSNELIHDLPRLYATLRERLPFALAKKFDETVFGTTAPGTGFDVLGNATAVALGNDVYAALVTVDGNIATAGGVMDGIAMSPQGKTKLLGATDQAKRPLFIDSVANASIQTILGAPVNYSRGVYKAGTPAQLGFAGDWTHAMYGVVEAIELAISDQASLTYNDGTNDVTLNLWQQNMTAIRAEFRVGFVAETTYFNKITA
jgi:HK97 family phage major capsid protein